MRRPNILFLMCDEHRPDVTGYEGNPVIRTPTLDWLAETGTRFDNAYTPSPICIPARQCMMTGQLPRTCGVEHYGQDLPPFADTFARRLATVGYNTVCCGKLHHMGPDQMQGWTHRPAGDVSVADRDRDIRSEAWDDIVKPGRLKWSDAKEIYRAGPGSARHNRFDRRWTQAAEDFIENYFGDLMYDRPDSHRPLLLKLSLIEPHYPYFCDAEKFAWYLNRVEPFTESETFDHPFLSERQVVPGRDVSERELRRATAAYYGMIEQADEHFAAVLAKLRQMGQDLDDWLIIYTSDHGEMLGEHGIWEKQKFFEASARVPLLIRYPRGYEGGRVVRQNVNLCDLYATLCEIGGVDVPDGLDSRSLTGLLAGDADGWDNESVSQFGGRNLMIKRDDLKYQWYGPEMPEVLFDLSQDPGERQNVIDEPSCAQAVQAFRARRDELGFGEQQ
ncbi:MAG: sulfatase-like hydrolase/transferase [Phycisphaerae bacterium]